MEQRTLTGRVLKVYEHKTGTSKNGKPWSRQRFTLETDDGNCTTEVWNQNNLAEFEGKTVRVIGEHVTEKYQGYTYEKFRTNAPPQLLSANGNGEGDPADSAVDAGGHDSWQLHLQRAVVLLAKCHEIARIAELTDGEDARTLFIECRRFIKDMPTKSEP
jgi:Domain of unknown function (DUF3127)